MSVAALPDAGARAARTAVGSRSRPLVVALASGFVFALGLGLAGMTDPSRVIGFLDLFGGRWDPTLAFVMAGAIAAHLSFYLWLRRRRGFTPPPSTCATDAPNEPSAPAPGGATDENAAALDGAGPTALPRERLADPRLLAGAAVFGLGWGLGGYCPGPAVVSVVSAAPGALLFAGAMLAGMLLFEKLAAPR